MEKTERTVNCETLFDSQPGYVMLPTFHKDYDEDVQYVFIVPKEEYTEPGTLLKIEYPVNAIIGIALHSKEQALTYARTFAEVAERLPTTKEYYEKHPIEDKNNENDNDGKKEEETDAV